MSSNVLNRVLKKCRNALLVGTPIIYINTDSDIFINNLLLCEEKPLIVLLSNGGRKGNDTERDLKRLRPVYELPNEQDKQLQYCLNYRNSVPTLDTSGLYRELYASPLDMANEKTVGTFVWSFKMPDEPNGIKFIHDALEKYIVAHENNKHPQYKTLQNSAVIVYSSQVNISPMLKAYTAFIEIEYPDEEEIRDIVKEESCGDPNLVENEDYLSALCTDFLGFTVEEVSMTMKKIMITSSLDDSDAVEKIISDHKRQKMHGGILEQCNPDGDIGGMESFRAWLDDQVKPLKNSNAYMRKIGTPPPKGVLLCGIPGCGKSEAAKFTAQTLNLPLLKMDIGSLMDKYQGVSEQKMRDALNMAEAMSPCVLWIDELEKGFSGAGANGDSSSFKRMFGYMLGWMQDNTKPCFIFATANDIGGLPKEFFRSGRFDALYAVYLPTAAECVSIFRACMKKAEKNIAKTLHLKLIDVKIFSAGCSSNQLLRRIVNRYLVRDNGKPRIVVGSDIQKIVNMALRTLSDENIISEERWEKTLIECIENPNFSTYGDGEENIDSIAIGYCRMLRKGFIPTSQGVLFDKEDYHMDNAEQYERLKRRSTETMDKDELTEYKEQLAMYEILQKNSKDLQDPYDRAVYTYLRKRINDMAVLVERHERDIMIR